MGSLADPVPTLPQLRRALAALEPGDPWRAVYAQRIRVLEARAEAAKRGASAGE